MSKDYHLKFTPGFDGDFTFTTSSTPTPEVFQLILDFKTEEDRTKFIEFLEIIRDLKKIEKPLTGQS